MIRLQPAFLSRLFSVVVKALLIHCQVSVGILAAGAGREKKTRERAAALHDALIDAAWADYRRARDGQGASFMVVVAC